MNRLARERSPYLLQHAANPVEWFPWGDEAFEKSRSERKPIFLSIGYSTCHWCHVMEHESFENAEVAAVLNEHFVSVKVDREERPDVDRVYMAFVQRTTGGGGWPMSVWLTPELKPFYGGTYFPPTSRWGRPGFVEILQQIARVWATEPDTVARSADAIVDQLRAGEKAAPLMSLPGVGGLAHTVEEFRRAFDQVNGGFGDAPKFPRPSELLFLLREHARTGDGGARDMVLRTLRAMALGGMRDHIGGGFHRYSVDEQWRVPHFEKMLYDQAQLAISYLEALQITGDEQYAATARGIFDYVLRDMTDSEGGFYSAEDADSADDPDHPDEKREGAFYVWAADEIRGPAAEWFRYRYGVEEDGNVEHDPHGEFAGQNILHQARTVEETAEHFERSVEEIRAGLTEIERVLSETRARRPRPHLDDKILTAWNGLMISALALGGAVLDDARYAAAACRAAEFVMARLYDPATMTLRRRYRQGEAAIPAFLDDYALFTQALLDLYEAQFDLRHLELALRLTEKQMEVFEDRVHGGFFSSAAGDTSLVVRIKEDYDGAEPSGNSVAVMNLLRLAEMTDRAQFREAAERALAAFAPRLAVAPVALPEMLAACEFRLGKPRQVILVGERDAADTRELLRTLYTRFVPGRIVLLVDSPAARRELADAIPAIASMEKIEGRASAYVCRDYTCQLPVFEAGRFAELLQ